MTNETVYNNLGTPQTSFIDLMGSITFTEPQISKRMRAYEIRVFSSRDQEIMNRVTTGLSLDMKPASPDELALVGWFGMFMEEMIAYGIQVRADNDLLKRTLNYEKALERLEMYILSEGVPEFSYEQETGEYTEEITGYSEGTKFSHYDENLEPIYETVQIPIIEYTPIMETITVPAIEPLELTITANVTDENDITTEEVIPNPIVTKDLEERIDAQLVVDGAEEDVLELVLLRKQKDINEEG